MNRRFQSIQIGRALAAQYVAIFHAEKIIKAWMGQSLNSDFALAGHSGVEFFFVLSGFIITHVHWRDMGRSDRTYSYVRSRVIRIYPIFWIVLLLTALGQIAMGQLEENLSDPSGTVRAILLLPFDGFPPVTAAWTLSHELLFYALFGLVLVYGRIGLSAICLWLSLCLAYLLLGGDGGFPAGFLLSSYNLLFGFGMVAAWIHPRLPASGAALLLSTGCLVFAVTGFLDAELRHDVRPVLYGAGAFGIIAGAVRLESLGAFRTAGLLVYLGNASYSFYLIHSLVMTAMAICLVRLGLDRGLHTWQIAILLMLGGNIAGVLLYQLVERPLLHWIRLPSELRPASKIA